MSSVLVIGGGLSGLACAVAAAEAGRRVELWSKVHPLASHSIAATGGINAAIAPGDSWEQHAQDTIRAGAGLSDLDAVEAVCRGAADEVRRLEGWGVPFNRDADGKLGAKAIGGSSHARTIFAGEHTGKAMLQALWQRALTLGVTVREPVYLCELVVDAARCLGAVGLRLDTGEVIATQGTVVLATGGMGRLYAPTTNAVICTGDGQAAALAAGAPLRDLEMTQFYPTTFLPSGVCVTEEARVQGATLVDDRGSRFMERYEPRGMELANRDVLSRAMFQELAAGRRLYLDCSAIPRDILETRLAGFVALARNLTGIDVTFERLPVAPAFHYEMGGIATDVDGRTGVASLLACGECACVSVHGGNRIGANSLLETLVMGRRAGRTAASASPAEDPTRLEAHRRRTEAMLAERRSLPGDGTEIGARTHRLATLMATRVGIVRTAADLALASDELAELAATSSRLAVGDPSLRWNQALRRALELDRMIALAQAIVASASARLESRGAHYRSDHPAPLDTAMHTEVRREGASLVVSYTPVRGAA